MTYPDYPVYSFLTASKVERPLSTALKVWLGKFSKMFVEHWREYAPTDIQVTPTAIDSVTFEAAQLRWSQPSIGVPINIKQGAVQGMIVSQRADMLVLLMEVLNETLNERPADRELTSIETSLCQLLLQQSIATFGEAWPDKEILPIEMGAVDPQPNRCRLFTSKREVLVTGFDILTSCGSAAGAAHVEWIFAKDEMKQLLGVTSTPPAAPNTGIKIPEENISQIIVDVSGSLGTAELEMNDLLQLAAGDIVKLNQRIEAPVVLLVNDQPAFEAWPGRSGGKQCFQVESIIC